MISVTNLSRRYGTFTAVDQVSFQIGRGEIVSLLGHNGAGKSTIMKMLTGYLEPSGGEIRIADKNLQLDLRAAQARIGYLPENCPLYLEMSVVDFLDYTATLRGIPAGDRPAAIRRVIAQTELGSKAGDLIATLSRGYRQRVGVAQALLHQPEILILDEPTNGLDPGQIEQMRELIRELGKTATVIVSTHILQEVEAVCERVLILRRGELVLDAALAELTHSDALLLHSDIPQEQFNVCLAGLAQVAGCELLESSQDLNRYRLQTTDDSNSAAAAVAAAVVKAGWRLFVLQPEEQSLETVFHRLNSKEVSTDAA